jgi:hypothetical protein
VLRKFSFELISDGVLPREKPQKQQKEKNGTNRGTRLRWTFRECYAVRWLRRSRESHLQVKNMDETKKAADSNTSTH